ncbi:MAG: hypothetical protein QXH24_05045 [Candidatus Bathyarchaeia archaeon]
MIRDLKKIIEDAILEYNRYRSPETEAKLLSVSKMRLRLSLAGASVIHVDFMITLKTIE